MEIKGPDGIPDTNEYPYNNRKIVIFADLVNASEKIQQKIVNHFTDGRHYNISPVYLTQSYYDTPQKLRQNCFHMILYPPTTKNLCSLIGKENMIDSKLFDKLAPYEFLFLDKRKRCKKNFYEDIT